MAVDAAFHQFGVPATYIPAAGSPRSIRVIVRRPEAEIRFEHTTLIAATTTLEVRVTDLPAFRMGEVITLDACPLAPDDTPLPVEPEPERFVQGLWDGSYAAVADVTVDVGHIIRLTPAGLLALARADADDTAVVAGVVVAGAAAGHPAQWTVDHPVERPDWSALTEDGAPVLAPGSSYFLSAVRAGGITRVPPAISNQGSGRWVVPVGHAVTPTVLHVTLGAPVKL